VSEDNIFDLHKHINDPVQPLLALADTFTNSESTTHEVRVHIVVASVYKRLQRKSAVVDRVDRRNVALRISFSLR